MIDRRFIEQLLHLNGVKSDASELELRALFREAQWKDAEIDAAIRALRQPLPARPETSNPNEVNTTEAPSDKISNLLGVNIVVDPTMIRDQGTRKLVRKHHPFVDGIGLWAVVFVLALILAAVVAWFSFYVMKLGPYHSAEREEARQVFVQV